MTSWRVFTAAADGVAHRDTGGSATGDARGYEDALKVYPSRPSPSPESVVAVAVADGHGHAKHFRSAKGAQLAVDLAVAAGAKLGRQAKKKTDAGAMEQTLTAGAGEKLVVAWRNAVIADLEADPPTTAELTAAGYAPDADTDQLIYAYGATLILTVAVPGWLLCAQIGDGDVLAVTETGGLIRPVPPDPNLDGVRTTSLCQPDAVSAMRFGVTALAGNRIAAVMLATDGYGNAQARDDWDAMLAADLAALVHAHGPEWVGRQLQRWAEQCASSQGSGDDVTVALMFAGDAAWAPEPYQPAASQPALPSPNPTLVQSPTVPMATRPILPDAPTLPADDPTVVVPAAPPIPQPIVPQPIPAAALPAYHAPAQRDRHTRLIVEAAVLAAIIVAALAILLIMILK